MSAQTFARGYKKRIQLGRQYIDFLILLTENILHWFCDFEDGDFNGAGKFCYRHGNFQNTEAATGGVFKIQIKVLQSSRENTYARASFLIKLQGLGVQLYYKKDSNTGVFLWIFKKF